MRKATPEEIKLLDQWSIELAEVLEKMAVPNELISSLLLGQLAMLTAVANGLPPKCEAALKLKGMMMRDFNDSVAAMTIAIAISPSITKD